MQGKPETATGTETLVAASNGDTALKAAPVPVPPASNGNKSLEHPNNSASESKTAADSSEKPAGILSRQADIVPQRVQVSLEDTLLLTKDSDFIPFMARDVTSTVRNAAMKKLFADPHFNVMDGLDIYIDDYSKFTPLPEAVLRQMNGAQFLNLFSDEKKADEESGNLQAGASDRSVALPEPMAESSDTPAAVNEPSGQAEARFGENLNNLTDQTVAQSYAQHDIAAFAAVVPTIPSPPVLASNPEASQQDNAHTDLRLQPDDAPPAPDARRGAQ